MKKSIFFKKLVITTGLVGLMAACSGSQDSAQNQGYWQSLLNRTPSPSHVETSNSAAGNYLSGRHAQNNQDWQAASHYMSEVLERDDGNHGLLQRTFLLTLGTGDDDQTLDLAQRILETGEDTELAAIYLATDALANGRHKAANNYASMLPETGFGRYTRPLLQAWSLAGQKEVEKALDILTGESNRYIPLYMLHAGFISEYFGRTDEARKWYEEALATGLSARSALAVGAFFERIGDVERAQKLYTNLRAYPSQGHLINQALARIARNEKPPANMHNVADGAALAMFDLAALLYERQAYESAMIYGQLAQRLRPDSPFLHVMMGDIMAVFGRYDEAVYKYSRVDEDSELSWVSRLRAAETLEMSGRSDEALRLLSEMLDEKQADVDVMLQIGDIHRRNEQFGLAVRAYDAAAKRLDDKKIPAEYWHLAYARGIALERMQNWQRAEKDFLLALEYQPDNPMLLNYLGYSWADKGINLDRALDMVRRAAILQPNDGYIVDSYGWVLFRMGEFDKAVILLERAVEYVPNDAVINDHLGDAYWQVGRKLEAQFQWQRAHDLTENPAERMILQEKIRNGLGTVRMINTKATGR